MKHATAPTLASMSGVLAQVRSLKILTERKPGIFYWRSKGYLHFHEDPAGLFADVRLDLIEFTRLPANTRSEQERLVQAIAESLSAIQSSARGSR